MSCDKTVSQNGAKTKSPTREADTTQQVIPAHHACQEGVPVGLNHQHVCASHAPLLFVMCDTIHGIKGNKNIVPEILFFGGSCALKERATIFL